MSGAIGNPAGGAVGGATGHAADAAEKAERNAKAFGKILDNMAMSIVTASDDDSEESMADFDEESE
ncbi:hypothetical protein [Methylobacterium sp. J-076]|uniref:hypothetical protein n=1 Tax=Methylobacterium sp. J-076 TaxID=2836655 RepID=UPI001FBB806C|nr:hypothetical protein [Methylobacterium sp. J-076]MCJ2013123.1 hypothetical protein [Methylobacterium sp. J-076]